MRDEKRTGTAKAANVLQARDQEVVELAKMREGGDDNIHHSSSKGVPYTH